MQNLVCRLRDHNVLANQFCASITGAATRVEGAWSTTGQWVSGRGDHWVTTGQSAAGLVQRPARRARRALLLKHHARHQQDLTRVHRTLMAPSVLQLDNASILHAYCSWTVRVPDTVHASISNNDRSVHADCITEQYVCLCLCVCVCVTTRKTLKVTLFCILKKKTLKMYAQFSRALRHFSLSSWQISCSVVVHLYCC